MNILFLCTHNRCRSILSEAITRTIAGDQHEIRSAGTQSEGQIHPMTVARLEQGGYETDGLFSKSFEGLEGFVPDVVITVCDSAANDPCPVWTGKSIKVHWGLPDPTAVEGTGEEIASAFDHAVKEIERRARCLGAIDFRDLDSDSVRARLQEIA